MLNRVRGANYSLFSLIGNASTLPDLIEFSIVEEMWRMNWKTMMLISLFVAVISYLYVRKLINNIIENAPKSLNAIEELYDFRKERGLSDGRFWRVEDDDEEDDDDFHRLDGHQNNIETTEGGNAEEETV